MQNIKLVGMSLVVLAVALGGSPLSAFAQGSAGFNQSSSAAKSSRAASIMRQIQGLQETISGILDEVNRVEEEIDDLVASRPQMADAPSFAKAQARWSSQMTKLEAELQERLTALEAAERKSDRLKNQLDHELPRLKIARAIRPHASPVEKSHGTGGVVPRGVTVTFLSVVHKGSGGITLAFPDV